MAVHVMFIKELKTIPATGAIAGTDPVGQVASLDSATPLDLTIADAAVQIPAGTVAMTIHETEGTAFRYATGGAAVAVPDAPNAHRWTSYMGRLTVGVTALDYFRTAAA